MDLRAPPYHPSRFPCIQLRIWLSGDSSVYVAFCKMSFLLFPLRWLDLPEETVEAVDLARVSEGAPLGG